MNKNLNTELQRPALIGLRFDENSSFLQGAAEAPPQIRASLFSNSAHLWTESGIALNAGILHDAGDVTPNPASGMNEIIEAAISKLLDQNYLLSLGGDHAVTFPIMRAFARKYPRLNILHFDAHPDLYDEFQGNRFSHACPFARIMEEKLVQRLVQVGIRTLNGHQRTQVEKFGVEVVEMKDWREDLVFEFDGRCISHSTSMGSTPHAHPGCLIENLADYQRARP
jgi:arginase family enzyme